MRGRDARSQECVASQQLHVGQQGKGAVGDVVAGEGGEGSRKRWGSS